MNKKLSVIIPTHNRSSLLPIAIKSALYAAPPDCIEVIVIPNGQCENWRVAQELFQSDNRIRWLPIETPNVSKARNHGLSYARGDLIRFLDDDDYLHPVPCQKQYYALISSGADICSGNLDLISSNGKHKKTLRQPHNNDFCTAILSPNRIVQVGCHLYQRRILQKLKWNEEHNLNEDMEWLLNLCSYREVTWIKIQESVAAWVQHTNDRLSKGRDPGQDALKYSAEMITHAANTLRSKNRFSQPRMAAAADGLWALLQKGLRYDRDYWKNISYIANSYYTNRRPPSLIHRLPIFKNIPPLMLETMIIPARSAYHPVRRFLNSKGIGRV